MDRWISGAQARRALVVGGGYIGLEMAEQLRRRGLQVALVEALPHVMAALDFDMAARIQQELRANGVELHLGEPVAAFEEPRPGEEAAASVTVLAGGARLPADVVVLALGVRPESQLARDAGLEVGALGGIRVDARLRTSDPAIYAVGDAIEVRHGVTGEWALLSLAGPANRQGRIAADNILGRDAVYDGTLGTAILRVFGLTAAATGATERALRRAGISHHAVHLHPRSHAGYYPGAETLSMKVIFAPQTGMLLGAQIVGHDGVDKRIDVLATALKARMSVRDLAQLELAYAPPYGSAKDPINLAGMAAENILDGIVETAGWDEVGDLDPEETLLVDVREPDEYATGLIPGAIPLPLSQLRQRLAEIPPDRPVVAYCQTGQRSYYACRVLRQHGIRARNLDGAWLTWAAAASEAPGACRS